MTYCEPQYDWTKRVQTYEKGVVHTARNIHIKKHYKWQWDTSLQRNVKGALIPARDVPITACGRGGFDDNMLFEIANTTTITCKDCMSALGMSKTNKASNKRYVLMEKESGYFYKKGGWSSNRWQEDVMDATLYKIKKIAESHGNINRYERDGKKLTSKEYWNLGSKEERRKYKQLKSFNSSKYEIKTLEIKLLD